MKGPPMNLSKLSRCISKERGFQTDAAAGREASTDAFDFHSYFAGLWFRLGEVGLSDSGQWLRQSRPEDLI